MVNAVIKGNQNTTKLINELKRAAKQYQPLSKDEEEALIAKYANNREKLNNMLFMHNIRLVFNIAKKYMTKTDDFDAMVQDGMLGLAIAAKKFDISRGVKFITYATPWVRKKIIERFYGKANEVIKRTVSLDAPSTASSSKVNDNDNASLESYVNEYIDPSLAPIKTFQQQVSMNEQTQICADLYKGLEDDTTLSAKEKKIFTDLIYHKEKPRDLQLIYGITAKDINLIRDKVLKSMRAKLESQYGIHSFSDIYDI